MTTPPAPISSAEVTRQVRDLLSEVYLPEGVEIWLASRNRNLGDRSPRDLIAAADYEPVLAEARRLEGGAW